MKNEYGKRGFLRNKRLFGPGRFHNDIRPHEPLHITVQHHQAKPEEEEQITSYVPHNELHFQQQQQAHVQREKGLILSTHFVDNSALYLYSCGDYTLIWNGGNRVFFRNIARKNSDADNQYNSLLLPTFFDSSVTSIAFRDSYIFYSTATAIYALQITSSLGPIYTQPVCLARKQLTDPGPLHSLTVHKTENLYVITIAAGYGVQYSLETGIYLSSPSSIILYEISSMMLKDSSVPSHNLNLDYNTEPLELSSSIHAYKYVLNQPIFAITTAIDQGAPSFFREAHLQGSKYRSSYPDLWPYNILDNQLKFYEEASFLKICISTATMQPIQPEILIITFLINLRDNLLGIDDNQDMVFLRVWHLPFINRSIGITLDTLYPAKDPLALSDDGSWLLCWSSATKTKYSLWILAFDVSFSSLITTDLHGGGISFHQLNLPCPIAGQPGSVPPSVLQLSSVNFSSMRTFHMLCRNGDSTALYILSIPRPRQSSSVHPQRIGTQLQPTLIRIDKEYTSHEVSPGSHIISFAFYKYIYYGFQNESQRQCEGICILWSDGSLSLARTYQAYRSQTVSSTGQQLRRRQAYNSTRPGVPITVVTQQ
ncbi:Hypothetical protein GLP15_4044 [Giardia lamblia P15]|uniref:Uncharacterized protein n=1 Tax=Giardia intestinalis (strain P15) TaxID=658858 RepID=E1F5G0_GIAIA|nr:Hypothetical protein GLP15_4044 [Giardia lamblia P15]